MSLYLNKRPCNSENGGELRKVPWTVEEDLILIDYIANHGQGVWNSLARSARLKRTGKSCRLRWLNYLRPDVRRGNITAEEQVLIIELHEKLGNRWSKIAKHLPGRTDNEIKNYWRTRMQKHLKQGDHHRSMIDGHDPSEMDIGGNNQNVMYSSSSEYGEPAYHGIQSSSSNCFFDGINGVETLPGSFMALNDAVWNVEDLWSMHLLNTDLS